MSFSRYILPFVLVILSGLMYVLYINPTYKEILSLREKKVDYEKAIGNAGEVRDLQAKLLAEAAAIDAHDQARLAKLLPESQDPVLVLYDLNTFARSRGIALKNPTVTLAPVDVKSNTQPMVLPVNIKFAISAPYAIFRNFMAELERELSLRDVTSLSIVSDGQSAFESSVFTYQIEIQGYAYQGKDALKPSHTGSSAEVSVSDE